MANSHRCEQHFFSGPNVEKAKLAVFVDLGDHEGDSLLRAIAAGIVDQFIQGDLHKSVVSSLMTNYIALFPDDRRISSNVNPQERLQQLIQHLRLSKLIQRMAYTLGQIIAKQGELIDDHDSWSATAALATALPMLSLVFQIIDDGKPLFKRVSFNTNESQRPSIVIQENKDYYKPRLSSSIFNNVMMIQPIRELNLTKGDNVTSLHGRLPVVKPTHSAHERIISKFEEVYRPLFAMVVAGELNVDDLIDIYTKCMTGSSEGIHHQLPSDIFDGVVAANKPGQGALLSDANDLVYYISRAVSLGIINDDVFSVVDALQSSGMKAHA